MLYAAVALHPAMKFDYFTIACVEHPQWIETAQEIVRTLWLETYKPRYAPSCPTDTTSLSTEDSNSSLLFSGWRHKKAPKATRDELDEFLSLRTLDSVHDPKEWWLQHRSDYPILSHMALDILAIPAMSAEVERVFSSASLTITDRRNRLGDKVVEAIECQKSWLQSGIIELSGAEEMQRMLEQLEANGVYGNPVGFEESSVEKPYVKYLIIR